MPFWVNLLIYLWVAFTLFTIAYKTNTENTWLAWVPIGNLYIMCKIAGKSGWWTILFFIPLVNLVTLVIVWMGIAKARNFPSWLGILMIIPSVNLIVPGILAFTENRF